MCVKFRYKILSGFWDIYPDGQIFIIFNQKRTPSRPFLIRFWRNLLETQGNIVNNVCVKFRKKILSGLWDICSDGRKDGHTEARTYLRMSIYWVHGVRALLGMLVGYRNFCTSKWATLGIRVQRLARYLNSESLLGRLCLNLYWV